MHLLHPASVASKATFFWQKKAQLKENVLYLSILLVLLQTGKI